MSLHILPYKKGIKSAKALANAVGAKRIKLQVNTFRPRAGRLVINWGNQNIDKVKSVWGGGMTVLNGSVDFDDTLSISKASNKLSFFQRVGNIYPDIIPDFTTSREEAANIIRSGSSVVARTLLNASCGKGIVICEDAAYVIQAPLYVKYIKKTQEYRYHVFMGEVIDVQRKMRNRSIPDDEVNWQVRNHDNGFVFGREGVEINELAATMAVKAVNACNIDFGAVDLIYNEKADKYYVLEINTAPGLEGSTVDAYANAIRRNFL